MKTEILLMILTLLLKTVAHAAEVRVMVVYDSTHVETEKLAQAVARGIESYPNAKATLKKIKDTQENDLLGFDGFAFGSPVYFGSMSGPTKLFLDGTLDLWKDKKLANLPGTVFVSAGSGSGSESAVMGLWSVLASHGMILVPLGPEVGTVSLGDPSEEILKKAHAQGLSLARVSDRLKKSELVLPSAPAPVGNYRAYKISGNHIYINQIALENGKLRFTGAIGEKVSIEEAKLATRQAALNVLSVLKDAVGGDLSRVKQAVQLTGHFQTIPGFKDHSQLMDEASDLLVQFLGEKGQHARAAMGAASLPLNSPVEIQAIFELR